MPSTFCARSLDCLMNHGGAAFSSAEQSFCIFSFSCCCCIAASMQRVCEVGAQFTCTLHDKPRSMCHPRSSDLCGFEVLQICDASGRSRATVLHMVPSACMIGNADAQSMQVLQTIMGSLRMCRLRLAWRSHVVKWPVSLNQEQATAPTHHYAWSSLHNLHVHGVADCLLMRPQLLAPRSNIQGFKSH